MLPLEVEVPTEERDRIFSRIAEEVTRRRMEVPAILALELHKPLAFLGSQALIVLTPMLAPVLGLQNLQKASELLKDPKNIELLIEKIEELAAAREKGPAASPELADA